MKMIWDCSSVIIFNQIWLIANSIKLNVLIYFFSLRNFNLVFKFKVTVHGFPQQPHNILNKLPYSESSKF